MKNTFILKMVLPVFLLLAFGLRAQTGLKVTYTDGTTQGFVVADSGKLYFSGGQLMIQTAAAATPTSLPVNIIQQITFDSSLLSASSATALNKAKYLLYPNPSSEFFRIKTAEKNKFEVQIFSADGKLLRKGNYVSDENINVNDLPTGLYLIKIQNETFKLLKK